MNSAAIYQEAVTTTRDLLVEAEQSGEPEPTAMTLATVNAAGRVSARIVLLKQFDERGAAFYTNHESAKGEQLAVHSQVALCLHWKKLRDGVQVRMEGAAERTSAAESDLYFATRPRESQIGAWASLQSQTLPARADLEARIAQFEKQFADAPVPRPPHWGGYRVAPDRIEIWYGQRARLHERVCYERVDGAWTKRLLYP
jgi:pyridoxamine 5'-phosphate oxidase